MELPHQKLKVPQTRIVYPLATRGNMRSTVFGTEVPDPYRWMEEEDSIELQSLLRAQQRLLNSYLGEYPNRDIVLTTMRKLFSYKMTYCPKKVGQRYILLKRLESGKDILVEQDDLSGKSGHKILVDGQKNPEVTITFWEPSPNGAHIVYLDSFGTARFVGLSNGPPLCAQALEDSLERVVLSPSPWTRSSQSLIYSTIAKNYSVYLHDLGTTQGQDTILGSFPWQPGLLQVTATMSSCGVYLVISPRRSTSSQLYFLDFRNWNPRGTLPPLIDAVPKWGDLYTYMGTVGNCHYFMTNRNSPNFSIVTFDLPERSWNTVVAEKVEQVLEWCLLVQSYLIASYLTNVQPKLHLYSLDGHLLHLIPLGIGRVVFGPTDQSAFEFFFLFVTSTNPGILYRIGLSAQSDSKSLPEVTQTVLPNKSSSLLRTCLRCAACRRPPSFNPDFAVTLVTQAAFSNYTILNLVTTQVWFRSPDGTQVPMYLTYCARIKPKKRACLLRCHGAEGVILAPDFDPISLAFMIHMDGIVATVNARGGGEFGTDWLLGGASLQKHRTFDDVQAAAEYLIGRKYTTRHQLILTGHGLGGVTAAVCVNQSPSLFACAVIHHGVLDLIRLTNPTEPCETVEEALNLFKYSPYHHVVLPEPGVQFPSVLVLTSKGHQVNDAWQAYKYVTELQFVVGSHPDQSNPLLLRVDHANVAGYAVEEATDTLCFMSYAVKQIISV